ncbi:hypothetical protein EXD76_06630 [BEV proteobacterium]|nr:hypothetical protein [Candidatus Symbiopectobacterium sp. Chty_BC]
MKPNCMILRCEDPSFHWAASIKSIYSTKPFYYCTSNKKGHPKIAIRLLANHFTSRHPRLEPKISDRKNAFYQHEIPAFAGKPMASVCHCLRLVHQQQHALMARR